MEGIQAQEGRSLNVERLAQPLDITLSNQVDLFGRQGDPLKPKPFLKWAGGKSHLLPLLLKCVPVTFGTYFEPFLGGGAVYFGLRPQNAVLGDSNDDLIHCYKTVRDHPKELIAHLASLTVNEDEYYRIRAINPEALPDVARAGRFIYLNKTCFNGLYRVNRKGAFNTPFGRYTSVTLADSANLKAVSRALKSAELRCEDYSAVLKSAAPGDLVYLDPPYLPIGKYSDSRCSGGFIPPPVSDVAR